MFATFTLSTWILTACAALWTVSIALFFIFRLARKRALRRRDFNVPVSETPYMPEQRHFGAQVHQELLSQHIDAVFNSLAAIVEAERLKLKALIAFQPAAVQPPAATTAPQPAAAVPAAEDRSAAPAETDSDIGAAIVRLSKQGLGHDEIARRLGLSRNEVLLAAKMNTGRETPQRRRLSAVA